MQYRATHSPLGFRRVVGRFLRTRILDPPVLSLNVGEPATRTLTPEKTSTARLGQHLHAGFVGAVEMTICFGGRSSDWAME